MLLSDNGIGIAPDLREKIFDLFVQDVHRCRRRTTGLGSRAQCNSMAVPCGRIAKSMATAANS